MNISLTTSTKRATLASMARELGLAASTVSFCLSGKAAQYGIKAETVKLVCDHAAKVGYIVNSAARQLRGQSASPVGILFDPKLSAGEMPMNALNHALTELKKRNIEVRVVAAPTWQGTVQLQQLGCRKAIVFSSFAETTGTQEDQAQSLQQYYSAASNIKLYCVNYSFQQSENPIFPNIIRMGINRGLVNQALNDYLLQQNKGGKIMLSTWSKIKTDPQHHIVVNHNINDSTSPFELGKLWAQQYLEASKKERISAIMTGDDRISAGLLTELLKNNVQVPQDVRLISFDNLGFGEFLPVPLTSWCVPLQKHVQIALDNILDNKPIPEKLVSIPDFSWRSSSGFTPDEQQEFINIISKLCKK